MEELKAAARKVVGSKQVLRALKAGNALRAYVGNDADTFLFQRIGTAAEAAMRELGVCCGVEVAAAAAAIVR